MKSKINPLLVLCYPVLVLFTCLSCNTGGSVDHHEAVKNITHTADLIDEAQYSRLKSQFDLETINNKTFGVFLGGLTPRQKITSAIKYLKDEEGLYPLECNGNYHVVLVTETANGYQLIQTKEQLREMFAPIDSPEEALSIVHLEEGGMPTDVFKEDEDFYAKIKDIEHVYDNGDGTYKVELVHYDVCRGHGEKFHSTYLVDHAGNVTKTKSSQIHH